MGLFRYDNPFIVMMVRIANMMIVSFYWAVCCLGVVTVLPACAALYYTVSKVVFGNGNGVTREFFKSFKGALKPGLLLSVIVIPVGGLVAFGVYTGLQIWDAGIFGTVYMAAGVLIGVTCLTAILFIPPALSRFEGSAGIILRLALYFSGKNMLRSIWYALLLGAAIWAVEFFPLLLLVVPALYTDLIRGGTEKVMKQYILDAGLEDMEEAREEVRGEEAELSTRELDMLLTQETDHAEN